MPRFAIITIELPLDGGSLDDAETLGDLIELLALRDVTSDGPQPVGRVSEVRVEDRPESDVVRAARAILDGRGDTT